MEALSQLIDKSLLLSCFSIYLHFVWENKPILLEYWSWNCWYNQNVWLTFLKRDIWATPERQTSPFIKCYLAQRSKYEACIIIADTLAQLLCFLVTYLSDSKHSPIRCPIWEQMRQLCFLVGAPEQDYHNDHFLNFFSASNFLFNLSSAVLQKTLWDFFGTVVFFDGF